MRGRRDSDVAKRVVEAHSGNTSASTLRLFYGCSYVFTCPAITVATVILRALPITMIVPFRVVCATGLGFTAACSRSQLGDGLAHLCTSYSPRTVD